MPTWSYSSFDGAAPGTLQLSSPQYSPISIDMLSADNWILALTPGVSDCDPRFPRLFQCAIDVHQPTNLLDTCRQCLIITVQT